MYRQGHRKCTSIHLPKCPTIAEARQQAVSGAVDTHKVYYNDYRCHRTLGGATPSLVHAGHPWPKRDRSAKTLREPIRLRRFADTKTTVYELAA